MAGSNVSDSSADGAGAAGVAVGVAERALTAPPADTVVLGVVGVRAEVQVVLAGRLVAAMPHDQVEARGSVGEQAVLELVGVQVRADHAGSSPSTAGAGCVIAVGVGAGLGAGWRQREEPDRRSYVRYGIGGGLEGAIGGKLSGLRGAHLTSLGYKKKYYPRHANKRRPRQAAPPRRPTHAAPKEYNGRASGYDYAVKMYGHINRGMF